jgi:hypothetical protein
MRRVPDTPLEANRNDPLSFKICCGVFTDSAPAAALDDRARAGFILGSVCETKAIWQKI